MIKKLRQKAHFIQKSSAGTSPTTTWQATAEIVPKNGLGMGENGQNPAILVNTKLAGKWMFIYIYIYNLYNPNMQN